MARKKNVLNNNALSFWDNALLTFEVLHKNINVAFRKEKLLIRFCCAIKKSISQVNSKSSRLVQLICSKLVTCLNKMLFILSLLYTHFYFELLPYAFFLSLNKHNWLFWKQNSICDQIKPVKWWCQNDDVFRKYSKNLKCFVDDSLQGKPGCNHLRIKSCTTMSTKIGFWGN